MNITEASLPVVTANTPPLHSGACIHTPVYTCTWVPSLCLIYPLMHPVPSARPGTLHELQDCLLKGHELRMT